MNREKMIWILLLVGLTSSVCGMFVLKKTPTFYQAEEDDNITIGWDSPIMSLTILSCFFQSEPLKLFYEMVDGVESSESQHQQFAGRVQCDKGALRGGRVRLHVSRVTTDDSGRYWCDLAANYDKIRRRWRLETTEHFVLNVAQTNDGESSDVSLNSSKSQVAATKGQHGAGQPPGSPKHEVIAPLLIVALVFVAVILATWTFLKACACEDRGQQPQDQDGRYIVLPIEIVPILTHSRYLRPDCCFA
ncbi:uncharacterized protein LOC127363552 isoform X2 [Dicentrarchus labrax]|uniref:uncharacterized protein LOC127363552 isoform X2 n=1 Tax=Dicentrarchus labrax TaxID=13489 RepID=UPI0021F5E918|nr:uncharacterized protein LOC127363552 isoform X2 [Dicentrarchus labrax]